MRWLGPRELTLTVDHWDAHDGGTWRYVNTDAEGATYGFHGVFHGDPTPQTVVQTFEYEGTPGQVALLTTTFAEHDGTTLVRTVSAFQSVEDRDAMIDSGMEHGINDTGQETCYRGWRGTPRCHQSMASPSSASRSSV